MLEHSAEQNDVYRLGPPCTMGIKGLTALISEHAPRAIRVCLSTLTFHYPLLVLPDATRRDP